jgi:hypothetical protein
MLWIGVLGRIAFFALDNTKNAALGQRYFVRGILDGLRGRLSEDHILVDWKVPGRSFRQDRRARIRRWLGV